MGVITIFLVLSELPAPSLQGSIVSPRRGSRFRALQDTSEIPAFLPVFFVQDPGLDAIEQGPLLQM